MVTFRHVSTMNMRMQYFPLGLRRVEGRTQVQEGLLCLLPCVAAAKGAGTDGRTGRKADLHGGGLSRSAPEARLPVGALRPHELPQEVALLHLGRWLRCVHHMY